MNSKKNNLKYSQKSFIYLSLAYRTKVKQNENK